MRQWHVPNDHRVADIRAALAKAKAERDALKARAERAEAARARLRDECLAWRAAEAASQILNPRTNVGFVLNQLYHARAAVDAHGDLEAKP